MPILVRIDVDLAKRKMSIGEFSERVGLTPANVAVLKNRREACFQANAHIAAGLDTEILVISQYR